MDPRDPDCLDKAQTRLGIKYANCLRTMLKAKSWSTTNNPKTELTYVRQLMRQVHNPKLSQEESVLIREILVKYAVVREQVEREITVETAKL